MRTIRVCPNAPRIGLGLIKTKPSGFTLARLWTFGERRRATSSRLDRAHRIAGPEFLEVILSSPTASWLSGIAAPLAAKFGGNLTLSRSSNTICWGFEGQSAVVELTPDGMMHATFIDSETIDAVSSSPVAAAYRGRSRYALNEASCARMVSDLVDFFSGVREPKFTFIDAYPR